MKKKIQKHIFPYLLIILGFGMLCIPTVSEYSFFGFFVLFAIIPILIAEDLLSKQNWSKAKIFFSNWIGFYITNIICLNWLSINLNHWIYIFFLYNSFFPTLILFFYSRIKKKLGIKWGLFAFISLWVSYEFIYSHLTICFPSLYIGTLFVTLKANNLFIQWYEYTGVLGGTAWVMICNALLFYTFRKKHLTGNWKACKTNIILSCCAIILPLLISLAMYYSYEEKGEKMECVLVQSNLDPYTEKFSTDRESQLDTMLLMAYRAVTPETRLVVFPETALEGNIWYNEIEKNHLIRKIQWNIQQYAPNVSVIAGMDMMQYYISKEEPTESAQLADGTDNIWIDFYNAAGLISSNNVQVYKKSKLVPGTEYIPFIKELPFLKEWSVKLGSGGISRGTQKEPSLLYTKDANLASVICFESLFGDYVSKFVKIGAEAIVIITNDGWWKNSIGYKQHYVFSILRAIENRRDVVRCGNTGISAFINQRGDIISETTWWEKCTLTDTIHLNQEQTFYSKYGDWIGYLSCICSLILILLYFIKPKQKG